MAISVADNFSYQGTKPLDARIKFDTVANMKAFAEAKLYDGCLAYVTGTKKYYSFDSTNTVDQDTGKWKELSTGGSYVLPIASDEVLGGIKVGNNLEIGNDGTLNAILPNVDLSNEISGHNVYSTTEKLIGQWEDGKPIYQKTFITTSPIVSVQGTYVMKSIDVSSLNVDVVVDIKSMFRQETNIGWIKIPYITNSGNVIKVMYDDAKIINIWTNETSYSNMPIYITLQYTKTTDSAQSIGSPNDYNTTEKIVGTWIDGKPIYQKTINATTPSGTGVIPNTTIANIDKCISIKLYGADGNNQFAGINGYGTYIALYYNSNGVNCEIGVSASWITNKSVYLTLQYTKSTT